MNNLGVMKRVCMLVVFCAAAAIGTPAQTFTTLHSFGASPEGSSPFAGLAQATNGKLYGTTEAGGANFGGTVFSITAGGTLVTLHSFGGNPEGANPVAGLVQATNGNLYGTTANGGVNGAGSVFKISPSGNLTTLYSFCPQAGCADGENPYGGLVQGTNGKFYGTTRSGGANGDGTVFSVTAAGTLTILYSFCSQSGCTDGAIPAAGLVQGTNGKFYGTTEFGGVDDFGAVFSITAGGTLTTLNSFNGADGEGPIAGLVQGTNGKFYGTTRFGGANADGTVFSITAGGGLTLLYSFCSQTNCADGETPDAGLVQGTDGKFYGTTSGGGANGDGTVFSITAGGTLTTLHTFAGSPTDGANPEAVLVQDTNGTFYGTTSGGGANSAGTVFSLSVGLGPFVETNPTSAIVGKSVTILGTNLTGTTSVTFNGTAATFIVVSGSEITTTVPTGATTGTVQVVTPSGTLSSNVPFRVLP